MTRIVLLISLVLAFACSAKTEPKAPVTPSSSSTPNITAADLVRLKHIFGLDRTCNGNRSDNGVAPSVIFAGIAAAPFVPPGLQPSSVVVGVKVSKSGKSEAVVVSQSSGFDFVDKAAKGAASRTTFKPGSFDGKPVEAWCQLTYTFKENT